MKKILFVAIIIILFLLGLFLLFYSDISSWYNDRIQRGLTQTYNEDVARINSEEIENHFRRAREFNEALLTNGTIIEDPFSAGEFNHALSFEKYLDILNIRGVMGHLEIPLINVHLPIFHTTSMAVLDRGVGHIEGTSFPIGGIGTHSVLTAHSGLVHSTMFDDLEKMGIGDLFFINVLNKTLAYEVDQIEIVLPHEVESLRINRDKDQMTLITCTPYAINTHRLLVRGQRIPFSAGMQDEIEIIIRSFDFRKIILFIILFLFFLMLILFGKKKKKDR